MEASTVRMMTEGAIDLEDRLTLPEFAKLEWSPEGTSVEPKSVMLSSADNRYSWMRTMQSRGHPLPKPVGGSTRASLYRLGDLVDWVRGHGEAEVVFDPWWALLRAARAFVDEPRGDPPGVRDSEAVPFDRLRRFLVGVAVLHAFDVDSKPLRVDVMNALLQEGDDLPGRLRALAARGDSDSDRLAAQLLGFVPSTSHAAARAARAAGAMLESGDESPSSLVDFLFEHLAGLPARAGVTTTGPSLAHLVVALGGPRVGERVVDPACGEGQLLRAAAHRGGDVELVGRDNDAGALLTAEAVLKLNGATADLDGGPTDSLTTGTELGPADLVLLDPPLGGGRHVVRWLRLASELSSTGRAVVVLPGDALRAGRREWTAVAERVVAVIGCPARLRSDTGEAPSVWVLGSDGTDDVLLVDASSTGAAPFATEQAEELASAVNEWRAHGEWAPRAGMRGSPVPRRDIAAARGELRLDYWSPVRPKRRVVNFDVEVAQRAFAGDPVVLSTLLLESISDSSSPGSGELRRALEQFLDSRSRPEPRA
jgi:SAM-dependent methyltransferase